MIRERALVYFKGLIIAWKGHCPWFVKRKYEELHFHKIGKNFLKWFLGAFHLVVQADAKILVSRS